MIEIIEGDLLNSGEQVIAHGCNCQGVMGAGIAGQIAKRWPNVLEENIKMGRLFHPGAIQVVPAEPEGKPAVVINMATQDKPGANARLEWVYLAFRNLAERCVVAGVDRVAIPQIGCGIGGLVWDEVEWEIEMALNEIYSRGHRLDVVCYVYTP